LSILERIRVVGTRREGGRPVGSGRPGNGNVREGYTKRMRQPYGRIALLFLTVGLGACASSPWYTGLDAEGLYAEAAARVAREDWADAVEAFERFLILHPSDARAADARMLLARSFRERGEHLSASAEYQRFLERHPTDPRAADAALGMCRSYQSLSPNPQRDQEYTRQAVTFCQRVALDFPGTPQSDQAEDIREEMLAKLARSEFQIGRFYASLNALDSAILYYEGVAERYPGTESAPSALLELYRIYQRLEWGPEAEAVKERLLTLYPSSSAAAEIRDVG
jgi:outer membrane protein assembly factor BamD